MTIDAWRSVNLTFRCDLIDDTRCHDSVSWHFLIHVLLGSFIAWTKFLCSNYWINNLIEIGLDGFNKAIVSGSLHRTTFKMRSVKFERFESLLGSRTGLIQLRMCFFSFKLCWAELAKDKALTQKTSSLKVDKQNLPAASSRLASHWIQTDDLSSLATEANDLFLDPGIHYFGISHLTAEPLLHTRNKGAFCLIFYFIFAALEFILHQ